jgi:hypothetical protein
MQARAAQERLPFGPRESRHIQQLPEQARIAAVGFGSILRHVAASLIQATDKRNGAQAEFLPPFVAGAPTG